MQKLVERYHDFLREVEPIMLPSELDAFLVLDTDEARDAWIGRFWAIRDSDPSTPENEYREHYPELRAEAENRFGELLTDRPRVFLARGRPARALKVDHCDQYLQPLEIWSWNHVAGAGDQPRAVFYIPREGTEYQLWAPVAEKLSDDLEELFSKDAIEKGVDRVLVPDESASVLDSRFHFDCAGGEEALEAIRWSVMNRIVAARMRGPLLADHTATADNARAPMTVDPNAPKIDATLGVRYPGKRGSFTSAEFAIAVPLADVTAGGDGKDGYELELQGEVSKNGSVVDDFLYRFNAPHDPGADPLPLVIERYLRPDDYSVRLRLTDNGSNAQALLTQNIEVPYVADADVGTSGSERSALAAILDTERRIGEPRLRIIPSEDGPLTGIHRVETIVAGDAIQAVEFFLDGRKLVTKRRPPWILDVNLGEVPISHRVKVVGLDADDRVVTGDEVVLNSGSDPFRVRIVSPRVSSGAEGDVHVEVAVDTPAGTRAKSLALYLNDDRVATLYSRPWVQTIHIPHPLDFAYVRAVATLDDERGSKAEDVVYLAKPEFLEQVDVHLVELPTTVFSSGKPVDSLGRDDFTVFDEGQKMPIAKFDHVKDLPLSIGIAIDTSLSMKTRLMAAQKAGANFLNNVLRPGDKAFLVSFDDEARMVQKWTPRLVDMTAGLANLRADETTALYDAVIYSLYNFQGIRGQRALIVLSDGEDTASSFTFDQALEYARRAGVPIYVIGIAIQAGKNDVKSKLDQLAEATGGESFYIRVAPDIGRIYDKIEGRLRSQYVLGFYPPKGVEPGSKWRRVRVEVDRGRAETIAGYYP